MNTYVVIRNTEQSEVLAKKISGDSSGSGKFKSELFLF